MKCIIFPFFIIICYLPRYWVNGVEINILNYSFDNTGGYDTESVEKEFEKYAIENGLNVTISMDLINYENPADSYEQFRSLVEASLIKSNNNNDRTLGSRYDMYFFDMKYTDLYGPYLLDLYHNVPKEHLDMYDSETIREACSYKDELVGLPTYVSYEILYSNKILLNKHSRPIPKTWDELIDTCKYIMEKENDPELICFN